MHNIEAKILNYKDNLDANLKNISRQIDEIYNLIGEIPSNAKFVREYDDEDDEDDLYDVWIEFPCNESK